MGEAVEERVTVILEPGLEPARLGALAREIATALALSRTEAQLLLKADALVLTPREARILAKHCRKLGVGVSLSASPRRRLRWLWALLAAVLMVAALVLVRFTAAWPVPPAATSQLERVENASPSEIVPVAPAALDTEASAPDLFVAARAGDVLAVQQALAAAPQVDLRDGYGQTPLMYAAEQNGPEVVALLLAAGAQHGARSEAGWTPLMYAARNLTQPEVTARLLAAGADPTLKNASGQSARDIALAYGNAEVAAVLLEVLPPTPPPVPPVVEVAVPEPVLEPAARLSEPPAEAPPRPTPQAAPPPTLPEPDPQDVTNRETIERCLENWAVCGAE